MTGSILALSLSLLGRLATSSPISPFIGRLPMKGAARPAARRFDIIRFVQVLLLLLVGLGAAGVAKADTTAPQLTGLSFPSMVDVSAGPATVTVNYSVTDDLSGATSFTIYFQPPGLGCGNAGANSGEGFAATLSRSDDVSFTLQRTRAHALDLHCHRNERSGKPS